MRSRIFCHFEKRLKDFWKVIVKYGTIYENREMTYFERYLQNYQQRLSACRYDKDVELGWANGCYGRRVYGLWPI